MGPIGSTVCESGMIRADGVTCKAHVYLQRRFSVSVSIDRAPARDAAWASFKNHLIN